MKRCGLCKETKDATAFTKDRTNGDGLQRTCRPCQTLRTRDWRARRTEASQHNTLESVPSSDMDSSGIGPGQLQFSEV